MWYYDNQPDLKRKDFDWYRESDPVIVWDGFSMFFAKYVQYDNDIPSWRSCCSNAFDVKVICWTEAPRKPD